MEALERGDAPDKGKPAVSWVSAQGARAAPALAVLATVLFSANGELLQVMQRHELPGETHVSPMLNLIICHIGGLAFAPLFLGGAPGSVRAMPLGSVPMASALAAVLLMGYNYAWLRSAMLVPAALTNAVFQTSIAFVYLASVAFFAEPLTLAKISAVALALSGSFLASGGRRLLAPGALLDTSIGVAFAVLAALGNTAYQVAFRALYGQLKHDPKFLAYFYAWIGVSHVAVILPGAHALEHMRLPSGTMSTAGTATAAAIATVVNCLSLCVVSWGSPMLLPCATALSIPVTLLLDLALHGIRPSAEEAFGQCLIVAAFAVLTDLHAQVAALLRPGRREARGGAGVGKMP